VCGIVSICHAEGQSVDRSLLERMTELLAHRGPDDSGVFTAGPFGLGHRRLKVIDLSAQASQPMSDESGCYWISYNGEVYNFKEIRQRLKSKGYSFQSEGDTEVVLHAYRAWGEACVEHIDGMFAFAIYDKAAQRLFCARDRFGIKPLYYFWSGELFVAASEIKAILCHPNVPLALNLPALNELLTYRFVVHPNTLFQGIFKVPPGYSLSVSPKGLTLRQYWDLPPEGLDGWRRRSAQRELLDRLTLAVESQLVSDVPLGAFLSGGVDSSTAVALMTQARTQPVKTFTVGFEHGGSLDERRYARLVASHLKTDHHELVVKPVSPDLLRTIVYHLEEPIGDPAVVPTFLLAQFARELVTVVLTGEGSDEVNGGYFKYRTNYHVHRFLHRPRLFRALARNLQRLGCLHSRIRRISTRAQRIVTLANMDDIERHQYFANPLSDEWAHPSLFTKDLREELNSQGGLPDPFTRLLDSVASRDVMHQMFYLDIKSWLADDLLLKVDKMTMAHGLEARVPYLDQRYVEFAFALPPRYKFRKKMTKTLLRDATAHLLPKATVQRPQHGFTVPLAKWFGDGWDTHVHDVLSRDAVVRRGYFHWPSVEALIHRAIRGEPSANLLVWMIVLLEHWFQVFFD